MSSPVGIALDDCDRKDMQCETNGGRECNRKWFWSSSSSSSSRPFFSFAFYADPLQNKDRGLLVVCVRSFLSIFENRARKSTTCYHVNDNIITFSNS